MSAPDVVVQVSGHGAVRLVRVLPECAYPPCTARVRRAGNKYCSQACCGLDRLGKPVPPAQVAPAIEATRARADRRTRALVLEQLRPHVDEDGRVPMSVAVRLATRCRAIGYRRGWSAMWRRMLRGAKTRR